MKMAASSDGECAIEVVIEKLQEIVDDIQKTNEASGKSVIKTENETEQEEEPKVKVEIVDSNTNASSSKRNIRNSTQINIVPIVLEASSYRQNKTTSSEPYGSKGTSIVITTRRNKTPSQVVLNFPVDAGEFNIGNTQGLIETLQKLNAVLSKGREVGQKSLFTTSSGGHFTTEVQLYKCAKCDYWSHNKYYLKQHVDLVHNAERVYKCPFCDYAGKRSHSLKEHLVVHSNYRPYVCSQCNASFRKKGHLTNHVKMHSQCKGQGNPVCPICLKNNFDNLLALHIHLREAHPSEVYSCDICQYATFLNKGNITMHMLTHGNPKVYTCSACTFTALHQRIMEEHIMEEHIADEQNSPDGVQKLSALKVVQESVQVKEGSPSSEAPQIWLKCTECGFSTTERNTLHDHMISKHLNIRETLVGSSEISQPGTSKCSVQTNVNVVTTQAATLKELAFQEKGTDDGQSKDYSRIRKIIEGNAPFKCWRCLYESNESFQFMTHMLKHRVRPGTVTNSPTTITGLVGQPQVVKMQKTLRRSDVTPDPPASLQPYLYDECNKWYQCTLCGYSSEHQRTIKAHIWKHSGHKDLDYPMFQNGPVSMFDEDSTSSASTKVGKTVSCLKMGTVKGAETEMDNKSQETPEKDFVIVRVSKKDLAPDQDVEEQVKYIVDQLDVQPNEVVIYDSDKESNQETEDDLQPSVKRIRTETGLVEIKRDRKGKTPKNIITFLGENENANDSFDCPVKFATRDMHENIPPTDGATKAVFATPKGPVYIKERNLITVSHSQTKAPEMAIEVSVHSQDSFVDSESYTPDVGNEVAIDEIEVDVESDDVDDSTPFVPNDNVRVIVGKTIPTTVSEAQVVPSGSPPDMSIGVRTRNQRNLQGQRVNQIHERLQNRTVLQIKSQGIVRSRSRPMEADHAASQDSSSADDDSSQISSNYDSSDAEIVTLLTMLKKGSNLNAVTAPGLSTGKLAKERLQGLAKAVRRGVNLDENSSDQKASGSGISSSLLAVIEQLRERTNSTREQPTEAELVSPELPNRKRKRRRAEEDIEKLINIEALERGGYKCMRCFYQHESLENVRAHLRFHEAPRAPYQCSLCEFEGSCSEDLQEHMLQHCKTRSFQCKKCTAVFGYKSQLRAHMLAHEDAKVYPCHLCEFKCTEMNKLLEHCKLHDAVEKKQVYLCKLCEMPFNSYEEISQHVLNCNNQKRAPQVTTEGEADSVSTAKSRSYKREYTCDYCSYVANTQAVLKAHMRSHDQNQNLQCTTCGFEAYSIRSLKSHMKRHVNDQRFVEQPLEQYKCNLCGYVCHHLPSLKSHMWRHASDKNYNYEQINEIINRALEYDEATAKQSLAASGGMSGITGSGDSGAPPNYLILFRCCQCGYESVHKSLLSSHMKTHMDIIQKTLEVNEERLLPQKSVPTTVLTPVINNRDHEYT